MEQNTSFPHSREAEQTVLGTIILDSATISQVAVFLRAKHFYEQLHQQLFQIMYAMFVSNTPIDLVTVIEEALREKVFETQDEAKSYLLKLAESVVNPSSIADYAQIIVEKHMVRSLMYACREIYDMALTGTEYPKQLMDIAEKKIYDLRGERELGGLTHIGAVLKDAVHDIEEDYANPGQKGKGTLSTSFSGLDRYIFGLNPSDLIIIAGRPGMGKTSFALNIAVGAAKKHPEKEVVIFTLEMSKEQLVKRIISAEARITVEQMRNGNIDNDEWAKIRTSVGELSGLRIYIDESSNPSVGEIKAKLRRMSNLGLVVIDYLGLMTTGRSDGNRYLEVSELTRNIKLAAKELNVPFIVAAQLSRAGASRSKQEKRPMLTDLRDSGSIEQDADVIIFLYKESYDNHEEGQENPRNCECIVAKNRQGDVGTVPLYWEGEYTKFSTLDYTHEMS